MSTGARGDYVLGTHDEEIARLGLQHRVWRPRALDAWRRAGFTVGQTLMDVGCGPGYAALDLAEIVGPAGRVLALDRSPRFLNALRSFARARGLDNIEPCELDLDETEPPGIELDGAWARWVFAFVRRPRDLLARVARRLRPGGVMVLHEYFDYRTWRLAPRLPALEEFVGAVMESWRATGGEPDVGLDLPAWLEGLDLEVTTLRPIVDMVRPGDCSWQWPKAFLHVGLERLVQLGHVQPGRAREIADAFSARESRPGTLMVTPAVLEIIAVRR